jgi:hypothetical protein
MPLIWYVAPAVRARADKPVIEARVVLDVAVSVAVLMALRIDWGPLAYEKLVLSRLMRPL